VAARIATALRDVDYDEPVEPVAIEVDEVVAGDLVPAPAEPEIRWTPQVRLLIALLDVACADLADRDPRVRDDARRWFQDDAPAPGGLSFKTVADHLGLDVSDVRGRLDELAGGVGARRRGSRAAWRAPRAVRGARSGPLRATIGAPVGMWAHPRRDVEGKAPVLPTFHAGVVDGRPCTATASTSVA
jgi:hypothetical protein